jgi:hypothetical protein
MRDLRGIYRGRLKKHRTCNIQYGKSEDEDEDEEENEEDYIPLQLDYNRQAANIRR